MAATDDRSAAPSFVVRRPDFESTDRVLNEQRVFSPTSDEVANANITAYMKSKGFDNYEDFHRWSTEHFEEYWADQARELHWFKEWEQTFDWSGKPFAKWFVGGKTNIAYN